MFRAAGERVVGIVRSGRSLGQQLRAGRVEIDWADRYTVLESLLLKQWVNMYRFLPIRIRVITAIATFEKGLYQSLFVIRFDNLPVKEGDCRASIPSHRSGKILSKLIKKLQQAESSCTIRTTVFCFPYSTLDKPTADRELVTRIFFHSAVYRHKACTYEIPAFDITYTPYIQAATHTHSFIFLFLNPEDLDGLGLGRGTDFTRNRPAGLCMRSAFWAKTVYRYVYMKTRAPISHGGTED